MRIDGWMGEAARTVRGRWPSVAVTGAVVMVIAVYPFPAEGHSALASLAGPGLGGELLEQVARLGIWGLYRGINWMARAAGFGWGAGLGRGEVEP